MYGSSVFHNLSVLIMSNDRPKFSCVALIIMFDLNLLPCTLLQMLGHVLPTLYSDMHVQI